MIGSLSGTVVKVYDDSILLDVNGVGYKLYISPINLVAILEGSQIQLTTYLVVRENALDLYGFQNDTEKDFFTLLLNVSGIGPKSALAILGQDSITALRQAISQNNIAYLTKVSGIGKKTAEKILIELRDKLANESFDNDMALQGGTDVIEALVALGYSAQQAREALQKIDPELSGTDEKIKAVLRVING
jgi:Holliday junction DNA helicase RuvA